MRLHGHYSIRSQPVTQQDFQISPCAFRVIDGIKLPIRGPFTQVVAQRGIVALYVSQPGETPLYYSMTPGWIHWSEQKLALLGKPKLIEQGTVVIWQAGKVDSAAIDELPCPEIGEVIPQETAIAQYQQCILNAVRLRLKGCRVAVAQSGGADSLLITWALNQLGATVVPMTVCSSTDDRDIQAALRATEAMNCKTLPIVVPPQDLPHLIREALICLEDVESSNVRMAIGNILMARKCQELDIDLIFTGHGHDDVFGKGMLVKGVVAQQSGTDSERWRDARHACTGASAGMLKMFASIFRRYGVEVRHPYYDANLLEWAFSQPVEVLPIEFKKQFVHSVARATLPQGFWLDEKYSIGYLTGAGLGLRQWLFKSHPFTDSRLRSQLIAFRKLPLAQRLTFYRL